VSKGYWLKANLSESSTGSALWDVDDFVNNTIANITTGTIGNGGPGGDGGACGEDPLSPDCVIGTDGHNGDSGEPEFAYGLNILGGDPLSSITLSPTPR